MRRGWSEVVEKYVEMWYNNGVLSIFFKERHMSIQYQDFIHPSDKKALDALKAIPGFDVVLKNS